MKKVLLAAAAASAVVTAGFAPALASASAAAPVVHHARCTETAKPGALGACDMSFAMGRHPGDVRVVVRTSVRQHVIGIWVLSCKGSTVAEGGMIGRTPVRKHLVGRVKADGRCRMTAGLNVPNRPASVTLVFSWVNR